MMQKIYQNCQSVDILFVVQVCFSDQPSTVTVQKENVKFKENYFLFDLTKISDFQIALSWTSTVAKILNGIPSLKPLLPFQSLTGTSRKRTKMVNLG